VTGLSLAAAARIVEARRGGAFRDVQDLAARAGLDTGSLRQLAEADVLGSLAGHRRQATWQVAAVRVQSDMFDAVPVQEIEDVRLAAPQVGESLVADYASLGYSLRVHPLSLLRSRLQERRFLPSSGVLCAGDRALARAAGIVTCRQKPCTAKSVFVTLEDETGCVNVIVHPRLAERQRRELLGARLLGVYGQVQAADGVVCLIAQRLIDLSDWLGDLQTSSHDFH
jgi:error-prone DNA polymerase